MRLPRAASAAALSLSTILISAPAAVALDEAEVAPFVRVTFICKATQDGVTENAPGFEASTGDYIFRYRNEGSFPVEWQSGVGGSGLHSGEFSDMGTTFLSTDAPVAGVSVQTDPGPNAYGGTASTNETQPCTYPEPRPTPTPTETPEETTETPEATEEPVPTDVPAGRPGSGDGVTSTQLAGLAALTVVGVVGATAATRARRQES